MKNNNYFKKMIAVLLCMVTMSGSILSASALSANETNPNTVVSFSVELNPLNEDNLNRSLGLIDQTAEKNDYDIAREFLNTVPFEDYGLVDCRDIYAQQLTDWENSGYDIYGDYTITIVPAETNSRAYTDMTYLTSYSTTNRSYIRQTSNTTNITKWVRGLINFGMNFVNCKLVTIPYNLVASIQPNYTAADGDVIQFISREQVTSRVISIKDELEHYGPANEYVSQICDQSVKADLNVNTIPVNINLPVVNKLVKVETITTANYNNLPAIKQEAYNNYIMYGGLIWKKVPEATLVA